MLLFSICKHVYDYRNKITNLTKEIDFIIIFTINIVVEFLNDELDISRLNILWDYQISREQKLGGGKYT